MKIDWRDKKCSATVLPSAVGASSVKYITSPPSALSRSIGRCKLRFVSAQKPGAPERVERALRVAIKFSPRTERRQLVKRFRAHGFGRDLRGGSRRRAAVGAQAAEHVFLAAAARAWALRGVGVTGTADDSLTAIRFHVRAERTVSGSPDNRVKNRPRRASARRRRSEHRSRRPACCGSRLGDADRSSQRAHPVG